MDKTLNQLTANQLIVSTVKSTDLFEANRQSLIDVPTELLRDELKASRASDNALGFRINTAFLTNSGKLNILFENLERKNIKIQLLNQVGAAVYADQTSLPGYFRTLNFEGMEPGTYTLIIRGQDIGFTRKITLSYKNNRPYLQTVINHSDSKYVHSNRL